MLRVREFCGLAGCGIDCLGPEIQSSWSKNYWHELVCAHVDNWLRPVITINKAPISRQVRRGQVWSFVVACIDAHGATLKFKICRGNKARTLRDVTVHSSLGTANASV